MSLATATDVQTRLGRDLNPAEEAQVTAYLEDAESAILAKLPDAVTKAGTDATYAKNLKSVEISITLRAARLTDAVQAAYPNTEDWQTHPGYSRANVTVLDSEWRKLGLRWYSSFTLGSPTVLSPGYYPDMHPENGPWWVIGED
jgi:Phage protein Gp19/Gp15/Gp42